MPEFPQTFILETHSQSTIVFIKNTESNQEKSIVIFTFKFHAYLLGTMAPFYFVSIVSTIRFLKIIFMLNNIKSQRLESDGCLEAKPPR